MFSIGQRVRVIDYSIANSNFDIGQLVGLTGTISYTEYSESRVEFDIEELKQVNDLSLLALMRSGPDRYGWNFYEDELESIREKNLEII